MLTVGSLFSGVGGLDLGLERAGMQVKWQVEIDPYCRKVLARHWPNVRRYEDVREVGAHNLEPVDLICGGFPCQPVSIAGQRKGTEDERWLWPDFYRLIRELRPRWCLAENVPGLLSIHAGRVFGGILRDLAACGYDAEWDCIPAAAVGAPHIRDRVFMVAYSAGIRSNSNAMVWQGNPDIAGLLLENKQKERQGWWPRTNPPTVERVCNGVPAQLDRLRGLGNAVVPQVAEWIGRRIVEAAS